VAVVLPVAGHVPVRAQGSSIDATSWQVQLRSTGYVFESQGRASDAEKESHFAFYQHFDGVAGSLVSGHLDFRIAGRFATDFGVDRRVTDQERLYVGYAQLRFATWSSRVRVGRQYLQEGTNRLTLDGAWASIEPIRHWELHGWGGARSPQSRIWEPGSIDESGAVGARVTGRLHQRWRVGASWAYYERYGLESFQPVGMELSAFPLRGVRAIARGAFDLTQEEWERVEIFTQIRPRPEHPVLSLQYLDRHPTVGGSSYFSRFEGLERIKILRGSLLYLRPSGLGAEVEGFFSSIDKQSSTRLAFALHIPYTRFGYSTRFGQAGEDSEWFGDFNLRPVRWLRFALGATFIEYALLEDAPSTEQRELVTAFGRIEATVSEGFRLLAEVQSLENPFYSEDVRLLLGLDLGAGGGTSRFGLGAGR
jgi:hypothetical protein